MRLRSTIRLQTESKPMFRFHTATALVLAASALLHSPAVAGTILPNIFADRFCAYRARGADFRSATTAAMRDAWISTDEWTWLNIKGERVQSDVVNSTDAIMRQCPSFANP